MPFGIMPDIWEKMTDSDRHNAIRASFGKPDLAAQIQEALKSKEALRRELLKREWNELHYSDYCVSCHGQSTDGHKEGCTYVSAINGSASADPLHDDCEPSARTIQSHPIIASVFKFGGPIIGSSKGSRTVQVGQKDQTPAHAAKASEEGRSPS